MDDVSNRNVMKQSTTTFRLQTKNDAKIVHQGIFDIFDILSTVFAKFAVVGDRQKL
jgi:hypothetical protein